MNEQVEVRWSVFVETDDHRGLIRAIKASGGSAKFCDGAVDGCQPMFDDDRDGRWTMSCSIEHIRDLQAFFKAIESAKYVASYCVYVGVDNKQGIRTEARIGQWTQGRPDQIGCDVYVTDEARQDVKSKAIKEAIDILEKASRA